MVYSDSLSFILPFVIVHKIQLNDLVPISIYNSATHSSIRNKLYLVF